MNSFHPSERAEMADFTIIYNPKTETMVSVTQQNVNQMVFLCEKQGYACTHEPPEVGDQVLVGEKRQLYVVKPLESITAIAQKLGVSVALLQQKNQLQTNKLFVGQKLFY